ncbi:hypothetical protein ACFLSF_04570 [Candidatus Bipolaricaulota bacterium]
MRRLAASMCMLILVLIASSCDWLLPGIDPAPNPNPTPGATLFFDDFDGGTDSAWQFASGSWESLGGWLHLSNTHWGDDVFAYIEGGAGWDDYRIEADVEFGTWEGSKYQGFVLRAQDDLNKVVGWASADRFLFAVFADGEIVRTGGEVEPGWPSEGVVSAAIEVQGETYSFYVNGILRSTFTDNTYSQGKPGLAYRSARGGNYEGFRFDNCRVTALD